MEPLALEVARAGQDGFAHEGVGERKTAGCLGDTERAGRDRRVEEVSDAVDGHVGGRGEQLEARFISGHRSQDEQGIGFGREASQASRDHFADADREAGIGPFGCKQARQLCDEQRVPARSLVEIVERRQPVTNHGFGESVGSRRAQRSEGQVPGTRMTQELADHRTDGVGVLVGARGDDEEHRRVPQLDGEESEQAERGGVGPVDVLEHAGDRSPTPTFDDRGRQGIEHSETICVRWYVDVDAERSLHLRPRPQRRRIAVLVTPSDANGHRRRPAADREFLRERRLACARHSFDDEDAWRAGQHVGDHGVDLPQFRVALDQPVVRRGGRRIPSDLRLDSRRARDPMRGGPRGSAERRIVRQHHPFELRHLGARVESEFVAEQDSQLLEPFERFRLPAGAVQRKHQERPSPLAQRLVAHRHIEFCDGGRVQAELDHRREAVLLARSAQLFQTRRRCVGEPVESELVERFTAPEREGLGGDVQGAECVTGGQLRARRGGQCFEA